MNNYLWQTTVERNRYWHIHTTNMRRQLMPSGSNIYYLS